MPATSSAGLPQPYECGVCVIRIKLEDECGLCGGVAGGVLDSSGASAGGAGVGHCGTDSGNTDVRRQLYH